MNPGFRCDEMQNKSYPKGGAEKLRWRQAGKSAGRKENTYNWTNGGNSQTNCKRTKHPSAGAHSSRMCQNALLSANRKKEPNRIVAAAWFTPPMDCMVKLITSAEIPTINPVTTKILPFQRCH